MPAIFISYRRKPSSWAAHAVYSALQPVFGEEAVFLDASIPPGHDFPKCLERAIDKSDVVVALIDADWVPEPPRAGRDFVWLEIERALANALPIIPVLVDNAELPPANRLPDGVRPILERQVTRLREGAESKRGLQDLIDAIREQTTTAQVSREVDAPWFGATRNRFSQSTVVPAAVRRLFRASDPPMPAELNAETTYLVWFRRKMAKLNGHTPAYVRLRGVLSSQPTSEEAAARDHGASVQVAAELRRIAAGASHRGRSISDVLEFMEGRRAAERREPLGIFGAPGSGKSTTLREFGYRLADRQLRLGAVKPVIPVYIELGRGQAAFESSVEQGIFGLLAQTLGEGHALPFLRRSLDRLRDECRLLLLFDGLDEMRSADYVADIRRLSQYAEEAFPQVRSIFTCRLDGVCEAFAHGRLVLHGFDTSQVRAYVRAVANTGGEAANRWEEPDAALNRDFAAAPGSELEALALPFLETESLRGLVTNPLLLYLFCSFVSKEGRAPRHSSEIFESYLSKSVLRLRSPAPRGASEALDADSVIASWAQLAHEITFGRDARAPGASMRSTPLTPDELGAALDTGLRSGILTFRLEASRALPELRASPAGIGIADDIGFFHQSFQHFLCARHIARKLDASAVVDWAAWIDDRRWQAVAINLATMGAGRLSSSPAFDSLLDPIIGYYDRLGSQQAHLERRLASVKAEWRAAVPPPPAPNPFSDAPVDLVTTPEKEAELDEIAERHQALTTYIALNRWRLSIDAERVWADRVVFLARLVEAGLAAPKPQTDPSLRERLGRAGAHLSWFGRPTTQVKLIWAAAELPRGLPLDGARERIVASSETCQWVQQQARRALALHAASAQRAGSLSQGGIVAADFARGHLARHWRGSAPWEAEPPSGSEVRWAVRVSAVYSFASLFFALVVCALAAAPAARALAFSGRVPHAGNWSAFLFVYIIVLWSWGTTIAVRTGLAPIRRAVWSIALIAVATGLASWAVAPCLVGPCTARNWGETIAWDALPWTLLPLVVIIAAEQIAFVVAALLLGLQQRRTTFAVARSALQARSWALEAGAVRWFFGLTKLGLGFALVAGVAGLIMFGLNGPFPSSWLAERQAPARQQTWAPEDALFNFMAVLTFILIGLLLASNDRLFESLIDSWRRFRVRGHLRQRAGTVGATRLRDAKWLQAVRDASDPHSQSALLAEVSVAIPRSAVAECRMQLEGLERFVRAEPARSTYYSLLARLDVLCDLSS